MHVKNAKDYRRRRHLRVRSRISGTPQRPRLMVVKSNTRLYVQFIDDTQGTTLAAADSGESKNIEAARSLGTRAAELAQERGIREVVFDRGGYPFHGRIRALVEAAVAAGLKVGSTKLAETEAADEGAPAAAAGTEEK